MTTNTKNRVDSRMLFAPDDLGFVGAVLALVVLSGEETQVAAASLHTDADPRVYYSVPDRVAYEDLPELSRVLAEFAQRVQQAKAAHP